jgi:hypothetical protein
MGGLLWAFALEGIATVFIHLHPDPDVSEGEYTERSIVPIDLDRYATDRKGGPVSWIHALSLLTWLATPGTPAAAGNETREGIVLPVACTSSRETKTAAEGHTKKCALERECVAAGYGLYADGKFLEFDDAGDKTALKYFQDSKKSDQHLVRVTGDFSGKEIRVTTLEPVSP